MEVGGDFYVPAILFPETSHFTLCTGSWAKPTGGLHTLPGIEVRSLNLLSVTQPSIIIYYRSIYGLINDAVYSSYHVTSTDTTISEWRIGKGVKQSDRGLI
jgi:hypothetical protein